MQDKIILDRKLICRVILGENVLSELLKVMVDDETSKAIQNMIRWKMPFTICGGEDKGEYLLYKAVINAGGIVYSENHKLSVLKKIPAIVLEKDVTVKLTRHEIITEQIKDVLGKITNESGITAFYKIGNQRWAIEVDDRYFAIYDAKKGKFSKEVI